MFGSISLDVEGIGQGLHRRNVEVIGTSTCGEIANEASTMFDAGCELGRSAAERFANPVVLAFTAGLRINLEPLVSGVHQGAGRATPLFGGVAGDDLAMRQTLIFPGTEPTEAGVIGLVLDGSRFEVGGIVANGWQPVGVAKTITRAEGNVVYTIDNTPALQVYRRYLEFEVKEPRDAPGVQYPLRVERENGNWVLRPPLFYQQDQSIIFSGSVPHGQGHILHPAIHRYCRTCYRRSREPSRTRKRAPLLRLSYRVLTLIAIRDING